jgi:hypothetical protein
VTNEGVLKERGFQSGSCVVVDEEGLKGETVLYLEEIYEVDEEEEEEERETRMMGGTKFKTLRCPVCLTFLLSLDLCDIYPSISLSAIPP